MNSGPVAQFSPTENGDAWATLAKNASPPWPMRAALAVSLSARCHSRKVTPISTSPTQAP